MAEDSKVILGESEETLNRIATELLAVKGYLSDAGRKAILSRKLGNEGKASRLDRLLRTGEVFVRGMRGGRGSTLTLGDLAIRIRRSSSTNPITG